jgi:predicted nucleic acid-binding protein
MAGLALLHNAELVHKDREFDKVSALRSVKL